MKPLTFLTYSVIKKGIINYFFILLVKNFFGLVEMTFGLVDLGYSLPKGQAVKLIFFAPGKSGSQIAGGFGYHYDSPSFYRPFPS